MPGVPFGQVARGPVPVADRRRRPVGAHHVWPHSQFQIDMRGHVLGMRRIRCHPTQRPRRAQAKHGVRRIIDTVNEVMRGAGMVGVGREYILRDSGGAQVIGNMAYTGMHAEQREGVEQPHLVVVGPAFGHAGEVPEVGPVAFGLGPLAIENLQRVQPGALDICAGPCGARLLGRRETVERGPRQVAVLLVPDRVVVSHRLAPVRHDEAGLQRLGLLEALQRGLILEQMQKQHALDEQGLCLRVVGGGGKRKAAQYRAGIGRCGVRSLVADCDAGRQAHQQPRQQRGGGAWKTRSDRHDDIRLAGAAIVHHTSTFQPEGGSR